MKKIVFFIALILSISLYAQVDYDSWKGYILHDYNDSSRDIRVDKLSKQDTLELFVKVTIDIDSNLTLGEPEIDFLRLKDIKSNEVLFNVSNPYFDKIKTFILDENIILIINKYFSSIKLELEILDKNKKFLGDRRSFYATLRLIGNV